MSFSAMPGPSLAWPEVYYMAPLAAQLRGRGDLVVSALPPREMEAAARDNAQRCLLVAPATLLRQGPFQLLPGVGVAAEGATGSERLVASGPLEAIGRVAVHPDAAHLLPVLQVILLELGLPLPEVVPEDGDSDTAVLLSGDGGRARAGEPGHDLGLLWRRVTGLPLVLGVWACGPGAPYRALRTVLGEAARDAEFDESAGWPPGNALHYRLLSQESDSLRAFHALAVKHHLAEAREHAIVFC